MSGFIVKAACRGCRPSHLLGVTGFKRPFLTARLLRDRSVARVVCAPHGYGKSWVAMEYAETVFSWLHVFWVNCLSPCFVRDLDARTIARDCASVDPHARLVVFDDLPALDGGRAEGFSAEVDALLAAGCEVVITCVPTCDVLGQLQPDQHRLVGRELLLSDDELDTARDAAERAQAPSSRIPPSGRVPGLVWAQSPDQARKLLRTSFRCDMPGDLKLAMVSLFSLGSGDLADLYSVGAFDLGYIAEMLVDYPHFSLDDNGEFTAPAVSADELAYALTGLMEDLARLSNQDDKQGLVRVWADIVLSHGDAGRACDVVRVLGDGRLRGAWLTMHARDMVQLGCFYPTLKLARAVRSRKQAQPPSSRTLIVGLEALCLHVLGNEPKAQECARRAARTDAASCEVQVATLLIRARYGDPQDSRDASGALAEFVANSQAATLGESTFWQILALGWVELERGGLGALATLWSRLCDAGADMAALYILAALAFGSAHRGEGGELLAGGDAFAQMERFVRASAYDEAGQREGYFGFSALLAMEQAHARGMGYVDGPLPTGVLLKLRQVELAVMAQRQEYERDEGADEARRVDWMATHPDTLAAMTSPAAPAAVPKAVPVLSVRVFGRFEVSIGGVPVDEHLLKLRTARVLLTLLVASRGREVQRESICAALWPNSTYETARKNFYSLWAKLRRALTLPDGTCPYLVRHQLGCRLDQRHVESDYARLDEICWEFLFGHVEPRLWSALFAEVESDFMDELLPGETSNVLIIAKRDECRSRLVDALVAASTKVIDADNPEWGIWFARAGADRDPTREDVYLALMRAQVACGQRTSAIMTYHQCRKALSELLGVDPSEEIEELYESLIE